MNWTRNGWAARVAACVGGSALAAFGLAGCDESSPLADAISASTIKLAALSPGGSAAASEAYKARVYTDVVKALQPLAGKGTPSQNASAYVLLAQAQVGLADAEADNAAQVERDSLNTLTLVEGALREWKHHNVQAATAVYDPNPELADIDGQTRERADATRAERAKKAEIDGRVSQLRAQARALAKDAAGKRAEQAQLSRQASNESAVKGEETLRRAAAIGREADGLEGEAADLEAQAAVIEPQADQVQNAIDRLTSQTASLEKARTEVQQRAATAAEQVKASRDLATAAARDIEKFVGELTAARAGGEGGATPYAAAVAGYQKAATTAKSGAKDANGRGMALLTAGGAQQSLGDVHWARAHGLARVLETLEGLTKAKPPLPNANRYQAQANETREARTAALEAATAAYQEARTAYEGAGSTGDARERFQRVNERLARSIMVTSNGTVDLLAEMRAAGEGSEGAGPASEATADASTVRGALKLMIDAAKTGDAEALFAMIHAPGDGRQMLDAMRGPFSAMFRVDAACRQAFGRGLPDQSGAAAGGAVPNFADLNVDDVQIAEDGDRATVTAPTASAPVAFVRIEGLWMLDLPVPPGDISSAVAMITAMTPMFERAADELVRDIQSGALTSPEAVLQALTKKMTFGSGPGGG